MSKNRQLLKENVEKVNFLSIMKEEKEKETVMDSCEFLVPFPSGKCGGLEPEPLSSVKTMVSEQKTAIQGHWIKTPGHWFQTAKYK